METTKPRFNYTRGAWQGSNYEAIDKLTTTELTKLIRKRIKTELPTCNFSITKQDYSGGRSISIALLTAPFKVFNKPNESTCFISSKYGTVEEKMNNWKNTIISGHHSINQFYLSSDYYLTEEAIEIMTKAFGIIQSYNFDDSDCSIDYFNTNFYLHPSIGKWDKPFRQST